MQAQYVHDGKAIDFTPDVDVAVGSIVIQGDLVGITKRDIKANTLGSLAVEGVFDIPKDPALAAAFTAVIRSMWMKTAAWLLTMLAPFTLARWLLMQRLLIRSCVFD